MLNKSKGFAVAIRRMEGKEEPPLIVSGHYHRHIPNGGRVRILESSFHGLYTIGQEMEVRVINGCMYSDAGGKNGYGATYEILRRD